ncbi:MAG: hypothetical protein PVI97_14795 [Candidatus Thiodiazotropha sp.]|jgi:hypothetical protein
MPYKDKMEPHRQGPRAGRGFGNCNGQGGAGCGMGRGGGRVGRKQSQGRGPGIVGQGSSWPSTRLDSLQAAIEALTARLSKDV